MTVDSSIFSLLIFDGQPTQKLCFFLKTMLLFLKIEETQNRPKIIDLNVTLSEVSFTVLRHDIFLILSLFKNMSRLLSNIEHSYAFPQLFNISKLSTFPQ